MIVKADLGFVKSGLQFSHGTDRTVVKKFESIMREGFVFPPILAVEDNGNGALVLDGHHRAEAAQKVGKERIPAWVISRDDFENLIQEDFGGDIPSRISDLDYHIAMPDGRKYDEYREDNAYDHD